MSGSGWHAYGEQRKDETRKRARRGNMNCANYMDPKAVRETVRQHQERYGNPEEPQFYDLSDLNVIKNCSICDFGGTGSPIIDLLMRIFNSDSVTFFATLLFFFGQCLERV